MKTIKTYIYSLLFSVLVAAFFSSFLTSSSNIVSNSDDSEMRNEALEIYYDCASSIPFSTDGHESSREVNTFQIKSNDSKTNFLLSIQSYTQLCLNKFENSEHFFVGSLARKKTDGYYLFNLCKLRI